MTNAVDKAKQVRSAGCSCIALIIMAPLMILGAIIFLACLSALATG